MIWRLDAADRQRLSRVLTLLDSPVEGARRAAQGIAWRELLDVARPPRLLPRQRAKVAEPAQRVGGA